MVRRTIGGEQPRKAAREKVIDVAREVLAVCFVGPPDGQEASDGDCRARGIRILAAGLAPWKVLERRRRADRRDFMSEPSDERPVNVFDPSDPEQAVHGWALNATRRRIIHEHEARRLDVPATAARQVANVPSTQRSRSAFAAWQSTSKSTGAAIATIVIGVGAAVLGSVVTFLDLGARAEAHRRAAIDYKDIMRRFEAARGLSGPHEPKATEALLATLLPLVSEADRKAPTVPLRYAEKVERRNFRFVRSADALAPDSGEMHVHGEGRQGSQTSG